MDVHARMLPCSLPDALEPLGELTLDLRWTPSHASDTVWKAMDPEAWELTHTPWLILQTASQALLEQLAADPQCTIEFSGSERGSSERPSKSSVPPLSSDAMGRLERATRRQMLHLFHAVVNADAEAAAAMVFKLGHTGTVADRERTCPLNLSRTRAEFLNRPDWKRVTAKGQ